MLDYEKNLGRTSMRKLFDERRGDLQVLQFDNSEMKKVKNLQKVWNTVFHNAQYQ